MTIVPLSLYLKGSWINSLLESVKEKNYMTNDKMKQKSINKEIKSALKDKNIIQN